MFRRQHRYSGRWTGLFKSCDGLLLQRYGRQSLRGRRPVQLQRNKLLRRSSSVAQLYSIELQLRQPDHRHFLKSGVVHFVEFRHCHCPVHRLSLQSMALCPSARALHLADGPISSTAAIDLRRLPWEEKGGKAAARNRSAEGRKEHARKAAQAGWEKKKSHSEH